MNQEGKFIDVGKKSYIGIKKTYQGYCYDCQKEKQD